VGRKGTTRRKKSSAQRKNVSSAPGNLSDPGGSPGSHLPAKSTGLPCFLTIVLMLLASAWTFTLYYESLDGPFIFDDTPNIELNTAIRWGEQATGKAEELSFDNPNYRRPVAYATLGMNYYFHGYDVWGYRVVNVVIHLLNGFVLYLLIWTTLQTPALAGRYKNSREIALLASLLFLVHPVAVQSVAYVIQRMASLSALFFLLSLFCYARARISCRYKALLYGGCATAAALALGSKENAAVLPIVILLYELYFFRNLKWENIKGLVGTIMAGLFVFGLIALFFLGENPVERVIGGYGGRDFSLDERLLTELRVVVYYLTLFVFPHPGRLNLDYNFGLSTSLIDPVSTLLSLLVLVGLVGLAIYSARRYRILSFAIWWYLINLVIESSVIPLEIIFEHRTYLSFMMMFAAFSVFLVQYVQDRSKRLVIVGILIGVMSFWTHERAGVWGDKVALWQDVVEKAPGKARSNQNLGVALRDRSDYEEAIPYFREATRLDPSHVNAQQNLGDALLKTGQFELALSQFNRVLEISPSFAKAHLGRGHASYELGRTQEAIEAYNEYLHFNPDDTSAHFKLGVAYAEVGQESSALSHFHRVAELDRNHVEARINLAVLVFNERGDAEEAVKFLREAVSLEPDNADIWADLGFVLVESGEYGEALVALQNAIELDSDHPMANKLLKKIEKTRSN
jgi:Flp pilus assembly protein TadD